jgi:hypothetical protein
MTHLAKRLGWQISLIVFSLLATSWLQAPRLGDEFQVDQDFRTYHWISNFHDPALFPDDPTSDSTYVM